MEKFSVNAVVTVEKIFDARDEQLRKILLENYEITSEVIPETTAQIIAMQVNLILPGVVKNNATLGKKLAEIYGDKLQSQHLSRGMAYNLCKIER